MKGNKIDQQIVPAWCPACRGRRAVLLQRAPLVLYLRCLRCQQWFVALGHVSAMRDTILVAEILEQR